MLQFCKIAERYEQVVLSVMQPVVGALQSIMLAFCKVRTGVSKCDAASLYGTRNSSVN